MSLGYNGGDASLAVHNGGMLELTSSLLIGDANSAQATVVCDGLNSRISTGAATVVGRGAQGELTIRAGGLLTTPDGI